MGSRRISAIAFAGAVIALMLLMFGLVRGSDPVSTRGDGIAVARLAVQLSMLQAQIRNQVENKAKAETILADLDEGKRAVREIVDMAPPRTLLPIARRLDDRFDVWQAAVRSVLTLRSAGTSDPVAMQVARRHGNAVVREIDALLQSARGSMNASGQHGAMSFGVTVILVVFAGLLGLVAVMSVAVTRHLRRTLAEVSRSIDALADGKREIGLSLKSRTGLFRDIARSLDRCLRAMLKADDAKEAMSKMALTDALTGLANRRALNDTIRKLAEGDTRGGVETLVGLMHVDLDHFKAINDRLGHDAGDFVLVEATRRMQQIMGPDDLLARIGGDEFVMVIQFHGGVEILSDRAAQLVRQFNAPILYEQNTCAIGASVGAVLCGTVGHIEQPEQMLICADLALTQAKSAGRNRHVLFDPSMARDHAKERAIAEDLHLAFGSGAFESWYQPMVDVSGTRLAGVEMLVRWRHPERGLVLPSTFLAIAESRNLTQDISAETFPASCRTFRRWLDQGIEIPKLYLNLSRSELLVPGLADRFRWMLDDADLPARRIAVEVEEEDCVGRGVELIFANLAELHELGVEIVLEGFGGTDASISNVIRLGVNKIKLSRTIVDRMRHTAEQNRVLPLLKGMIGFGTELGIVMVGKGVSTPSQISTLTNLGCTELQGDAIAPAMSEHAAELWLSRHGKLGRSGQAAGLATG